MNVFHLHQLRHTAASLAIGARADVKVVQVMLGHKGAKQTLNQYGHLMADNLDVVTEAMTEARKRALNLDDSAESDG